MTAQPELTDDQEFSNAPDVNGRDTRIDVKFEARLYRSGKEYEDISIENISVHGIQAVCDLPPLIGEAIEIEFDELGLFQGVVRWQRQNSFGVHTFERLDLGIFSNPQK